MLPLFGRDEIFIAHYWPYWNPLPIDYFRHKRTILPEIVPCLTLRRSDFKCPCLFWRYVAMNISTSALGHGFKFPRCWIVFVRLNCSRLDRRMACGNILSGRFGHHGVVLNGLHCSLCLIERSDYWFASFKSRFNIDWSHRSGARLILERDIGFQSFSAEALIQQLHDLTCAGCYIGDRSLSPEFADGLLNRAGRNLRQSSRWVRNRLGPFR